MANQGYGSTGSLVSSATFATSNRSNKEEVGKKKLVYKPKSLSKAPSAFYYPELERPIWKTAKQNFL